VEKMSIPKPTYDLKNHCSTVWNNTVYVYNPDGFQSLSLTEGAKWTTLPSGQAVTGGICAPAMADGNEALYIVGGSTTTFAPDYPGLQRFDFASGSWGNITPAVPVTANRQNHGAQYINSTNSILVYSGSQDTDNKIPSTQTFLISTAPPYSVSSFNSQGAPPLLAPILMPWDQDHAVMVGGAADNKQVWTFGKDAGWQNIGTTLLDPIVDQTTTQCSIVTGDDSSKVLEIYDLGVTPNTVTRYALWLGSDNKAAPVGKVVGAPPSRKRRRDLTVSNWPTYNSSLAPTIQRSAYSLAEAASGLVVITGGSTSDPIAMFDQRENTWLNATSVLVAKNQIPLTSSTSSLPSISTVTPTATSASSPSSTSSGVVGGTSHQPKTKVLTVLGATLGAIFGIAAILIFLLVLLKWKKEKSRKADQEVNEKNGRLSFADQGAEFMHEAGGSRGRAYSASLNGSVTSLQFFSKTGPKSGAKSHTRGVPSDSSQLGLVNGKSPLGANEPMEMSQMSQKTSLTFTARSLDPKLDTSPPQTSLSPLPVVAASAVGAGAGLTASNAAAGPDTERSRSNGWSRYFANNDVTNLATMQPNNRSRYSEAETYRTSMSRSEYDDVRNMGDPSVRPLELNLGPKFDTQRISSVNTGSPTMGVSVEHMRDGMSAEIRRTGSTSSRGSDAGDMYESTVNTQPTTTTWTPASNNGGWSQPTRTPDTRSMGSNYSTDSLNPFAPNENGQYAPDNPLGGFLNSAKSRNVPPPPALPTLEFNRPNFGDVNRDSSGSAMTVFPSGIGANSPKLHTFPNRPLVAPPQAQAHTDEFDFPMPRAYFGQQRDSNASAMSAVSNMTVFPGGAPASPTVKSFNKPNVPQPTATSFSKPTMVDTRRPFVASVQEVPPSPAWRGPVIRKQTGDEDMSWLNINAGRV
jgi:hypothetical protein